MIQLAAAYFTYEEISVLAPHVGVGGDVHGFSLKRPQRAGVWRHEERHTFPVSQQVAHKLCQHREAGQLLSQTPRLQQHGHRPVCALSSSFLACSVPSGVWKYLQFKTQPLLQTQSLRCPSSQALVPFPELLFGLRGAAGEILRLYGERGSDGRQVGYQKLFGDSARQLYIVSKVQRHCLEALVLRSSTSNQCPVLVLNQTSVSVKYQSNALSSDTSNGDHHLMLGSE